MEPRFDRAAEDLGNIVKLEHVNVRIPDQRLSTLFYVAGLGFTRDPYIMVSTNNMWVNMGTSQFHLPTGGPDVLRGVAGLVVPDRRALLDRLAKVKDELAGTKFAYAERNDYVEATCPWGNRFRLHEPNEKLFGKIVLGVPYICFDVPEGTTEKIARFYREVLGTNAHAGEDEDAKKAWVQVGPQQHLIFRETERELPPYDQHHLQIYIADFSKPYRKLKELGLITADVLEHEYRFTDIVDLETRKPLFTVEHEVRSMRHPLYGRPLVNRNPAQTNTDYHPGHDAMAHTTGWA
jgi:catechol 2,3-dioxygenase-like lactoylglutathione lyase family enzyme